MVLTTSVSSVQLSGIGRDARDQANMRGAYANRCNLLLTLAVLAGGIQSPEHTFYVVYQRVSSDPV